jgi:hypothetical protein
MINLKRALWAWKFADTTQGGDVVIIGRRDVLRVFKFTNFDIVTITGSDELLDWVSNFLAFPRNQEHWGYAKSAEELFAKLIATYPEIVTRKVIFACHSRGAGVGACIMDSFPTPGECYFFGSPSTHYEIDDNIHTVYQIDNGVDPVCGFPSWLDRYGEIVRLDAPWWHRFRPIRAHLEYGKALERAIAKAEK